MPKGLVCIGAQMNITMHNIAKYARCATAFSVSSCVLVLNARLNAPKCRANSSKMCCQLHNDACCMQPLMLSTD